MIAALFKRSVPTLAAETYVPGPLDSKIHLLEARRRRGKSYGLMYWAVSAFMRKIPVVANYSIDLYRVSMLLYSKGVWPRAKTAYEWLNEVGYRRLHSWDDVFSAMDCHVQIDEAHHYMDSRSFRDTPPEFVKWLQYSGKLGVTCEFASHSFEFLDLRVRRLADILWIVRRENIKKSSQPARFWYYGLDPWAGNFQEEVVRDRADYKFTIPFFLDVAVCYQTMELIEAWTGRVSFNSIVDAYAGRQSALGGALGVAAPSRRLRRADPSPTLDELWDTWSRDNPPEAFRVELP